MYEVLIAMSGGVDSSVAASLLKHNGCHCSGAFMTMFSNSTSDCCCAPLSNAADARCVALSLGFPFYEFDFSDVFAQSVIKRFVDGYSKGVTPNPCVDCNKFIKFGYFLNRALELGFDKIATGHYANIEFDSGSQRYLLKKAADSVKDQSYFLYSMNQEQLSRTILPLGTLEKQNVRELAEELNLITASKQESQDICFVPYGDYAEFIERYTGLTFGKGAFIDSSGKTLGEHQGIVRYTIGQRRGLGISHSEPLYVREIRPDSNSIVLSTNSELYSRVLTTRNVNLIATERLTGSIKAEVKIRYRHNPQSAVIRQIDDDELLIEFDSPQRAITHGQSAVIYDGNTVIGGGIISVH